MLYYRKEDCAKETDGMAKGRRVYVNILFLTLAGIVNAAGVTLFLVPWELLDGGLSGTSFLMSSATGVSLSVWLIVFNFPFFLLAWRRMGASTVLYSLYAIAVYSLTSFLFQSVFRFCGPDKMQSPFVTKEYDIILAAVFGGLISGIGSGLTIRFGGAMDGVEVMGVMFAKRVGLTVGQFVMAYNAVLYIVAGVVFKDFQVPLYSVIAYAVGLKAVDFIVEGLDKGKAAFIITDNPDEVGKAISAAMGRGITMMDAHGFYSKAKKGLLYCVVNRFEIGSLKRIISDIDPDAFVSVSDVSDMLGSDVKLNLRKIKREKTLLPPLAEGDIPPVDCAAETEEPPAETSAEQGERLPSAPPSAAAEQPQDENDGN